MGTEDLQKMANWFIQSRVSVLRVAFVTVFTFFLLAATILVAYELAFVNRVYPGVSIAGIPVGGLTRKEAGAVLARHTQLASAIPLSFLIAGQTYTITADDAVLSYDVEQTVERAWLVGRYGSVIEQLSHKRSAYLLTTDLSVSFLINPEKVHQVVLDIATKQNVPATNARFIASDSAITIQPEVAGRDVDPIILLNEIYHQLATLERYTIGIPTVSLAPTVTTVQLAGRLEAVAERAAALPRFEAAEVIQTPTLAQLALWYSPPESSPSASVNEDAIRAYGKELATKIDRPPQDALFRVEGNRVAAFRPSVDGRSLDQEKAVLLIVQYLQREPAATQSASLALPIVTSPPAIRIDSINDLGIRELLGRGVSKFAGSIPGRMHNIRLSAQRISGVILKPGEEFSFNASVGDVSKETGYQPAYIIESGKTILGDGGGVCQTSTTLFRAVLNAGLPITERHPHAYRVGYYEQNSSPGFDATVYAPTVDFKFRNDTPAHLLVQTIYDANTSTLITEIYGTSDGRGVSTTKPTITGETKPPPARYQEDPTLPKGTTKQVDWSAWGAKVSFRRIVTRGGEVRDNSTFTSPYRPWQAVFLVGMKG